MLINYNIWYDISIWHISEKVVFYVNAILYHLFSFAWIYHNENDNC